MRNKFCRLFLLCWFLSFSGLLFGIGPYDLDGTWIYSTDLLNSPAIHEMNYIWGKGKSITETTMEFEIEKMYILIPGQGSHTISAIEPAGPDTIFVKLFYIGDEKKEHPIRMKFHFLDINTFWIECPEWNEMFIVGNDKPWYRLSGPQRK